MKRLVGCSARTPQALRPCRGGYTIFELLMATTLTLVLMLVVVTIFSGMSGAVQDSRALLETFDRVRTAKARLQLDFEGITVLADPPRRAEAGDGYLEIVEGPVGPVVPPYLVALNSDASPPQPDTTVGDFDDVVAFTTRSRGAPFVGRFHNVITGEDVTIESYEAEVIWFVRGRTLYRRLLLIAPQAMPLIDQDYNGASSAPTDGNGVIDVMDRTDRNGNRHSFHERYDLSARPEPLPPATLPTNPLNWNWGWVLNNLRDLAKRENRYAHRVHPVDAFPFDARRWGQLGLPTLRECSHPVWMTWPDAGSRPAVTPQSAIDLWSNNPHPWPELDPVTGTLQLPGPGAPPRFMGPRVADDAILTNVIGFDVKVWDPNAPIFGRGGEAIEPGDPAYQEVVAGWLASPASGGPISYGAYVDLNYMCLVGPETLPADPRAREPLYRVATQPPFNYPEPHFYGAGRYRSGLRGTEPYAKNFADPTHWPPPATWLPSVYDTWSFDYEHDGVTQDDDNLNGRVGDPGDLIDEGTDGFDNDGDGEVDDALDLDIDGDRALSMEEFGELETSPPYPKPLRGIQIKIRVFEPDSRKVREVTVIADLTPK